MPAAAESFDYVIVGSGPTGSVIANRLSANRDTSVLLLEAGDADVDPNIHAPDGFVKLWGSSADWAFPTEAQSGMQGRQITLNQGKVVGGGSSINALMYVRGNRRNYDAWSAAGATGWSYADVLPYFRKLEDFEKGPSEFHGAGGPLHVRECPEEAMRSEEFLSACTEVGYDGPRWDYNGARQENGAGYLQFHIDREGRRASGATAYLRPALSRPNLRVRIRCEVTRVVLEGTRAVGVEYEYRGKRRQVRANRETILSAGALQTPKLLMLSGIGAADLLRSHGIDVAADLPGVGENLQDHVQLPIVFRTKSARPKPGLLTGNAIFLNTRDDEPAAAPDLQLNFTPAVPAQLAHRLDFGGPACIFLAILVQPQSRGTVRLRSADPHDRPVVDPRYLADPADVTTLGNAVDLARRIASARAFSEMNGGEILPGAMDSSALEGFIRSAASTLWHPAGTCRIGNDAMAVVDPQLRVRGIDRLRVADASVMPAVPSGNTVAACFMIGEKASDLIGR